MSDEISYKSSGVDIDAADAMKAQLTKDLEGGSPRVLNGVGAFASLYDFDFEDIQDPVLVLKMEEPGSKQLLASQHGRLASVGYDLVNHLINDTIMVGARPLAILDTIVCGKLDNEDVLALISAMRDACQQQGCDLVGGETSEQPRVLPEGSYILSAASAGVVSKQKIIDGSAIQEGDCIYAVASNGVHTNGYTLIRSLLERDPSLVDQVVGTESFLDAVLRPHCCYNRPLQKLFQDSTLHGLAHITGGGVVDNTARILPDSLQATIDLSSIDVLPIFSAIQKAGNVAAKDMLRTFNVGVGLVIIAPKSEQPRLTAVFNDEGLSVYPIGSITRGADKVVISGELTFV